MKTNNNIMNENTINNSNISEIRKKILYRWYKYGTSGISLQDAIKTLDCYIGNIEFDIENLKSDMKVKEAIVVSKFRKCSIFDNDFDDAPELANLTLKEVYDNLKDNMYWDMYRNIDTAVRSQVSYIVCIACGYYKNMTPEEIYYKQTL